MELFRELLISVGISLLVSFVLAKLFSMASPSPSTTPHDTISSSSSSPSPALSKESVFVAQNPDQLPTRVSLSDQAVQLNQLEQNDLSRAQTIGSILNCDDDDDDEGHSDNKVVLSREDSDASTAVGLENRIKLEGSGSSILTEAAKVGGVEYEDQVFDEIPETAGFREIEIESGRDEVNVGDSEGNKGHESDGVGSNENEDGGEEGEGGFGDWEGVERTELEKRFADAVVFVGSKSNADRISRLDSDAKMQLYGLHKVAIEGTCSVPSPMALKANKYLDIHHKTDHKGIEDMLKVDLETGVSCTFGVNTKEDRNACEIVFLKRTNNIVGNAWQQLGDMSREVAMEQYISLLSRSIPGYDAKGFSDENSAPVPTVNVHNRHVTENESSLRELKPGEEGCGMTGSFQTP
ncbi:hypothetical protein RHMOL_Rhmol08G0109400 [Rhododendron molle]|uniref:Uncharacterized protein n=2 Tax=Rhododendron molle TaxID=49168 RepID=A0ACC0MMD4_RHOML|nr:hypothetical protein RHMOL_Rhmol08G0109400 [Rhododendron molle]KAI8542055.1 hypothetical protein RHMOL_Rhmol08G0109400 [Rhododendron molle]